jgi:hypothetical protein
MLTITITQDTFAKQSTAAANTLPSDKIHYLESASQLKAVACQAKGGAHSTVTFAEKVEGYQSWILFNGHFRVEGLPQSALSVPYFSQRDNVVEWWRTCNTSSCAMVAEYLKPGSCKGSDDWYFAHCVTKEGDSTDHAAQTRALQRIGIKSSFHYNLDYGDLDRELDRKHPVVIGVLHKGTISSPYGGHMIVVIGRYAEGYICHDPWGYGFGYTDTNGKAVKYPYRSLDGRWLADGKRSGWGRVFNG